MVYKFSMLIILYHVLIFFFFSFSLLQDMHYDFIFIQRFLWEGMVWTCANKHLMFLRGLFSFSISIFVFNFTLPEQYAWFNQWNGTYSAPKIGQFWPVYKLGLHLWLVLTLYMCASTRVEETYFMVSFNSLVVAQNYYIFIVSNLCLRFNSNFSKNSSIFLSWSYKYLNLLLIVRVYFRHSLIMKSKQHMEVCSVNLFLPS